MLLIIGLGNPGRKYAKTRHNLGFMVVDEVARRHAIAADKEKFQGLFGQGFLAGRRVGLLKPQTYMNRSGQSVVAASGFYQVSSSNVLIVLDDLDLPLGRIRIRAGGSAGGHNGLIDILNRLGTDEVPRLRVGIGSPPEGIDPVEYVLATFLREELAQVEQAINLAADAIEVLAAEGHLRAMDRYNRLASE